MKIDEFKNFVHQYEKEPVLFFVPVEKCDRDDLYKMTRQELTEIASDAIPLSDFDTDWNDTDSSNGMYAFIPNPFETWCEVNMP